MLGSVAARGGCILWPLTHYFRLSSPKVIGEFNTVRDGKLIMLDHSICLRNAMLGVSEEQLEAVAPLGWVAEDFRTDYFDYSGDKPLWIFSNWTDLGRRIYRHDRTGITIPFLPPRTDEERAAQLGLKSYLDANFSAVSYDDNEMKQTLNLMFSRIPGHGILFLLLITECDRQADGSQAINPRRQAFNRCCLEAAAPYANVRPVRVADFIDDDAEILNERVTHFDRKVYHRLYLHMKSVAMANLEAQGSRTG